MKQVGIHISNYMHRKLWRLMEIPWGCATLLHLNCSQFYSHMRIDGRMDDYTQDGHNWTIPEAYVRGVVQQGWCPTVAHPGLLLVRYYRKGWRETDSLQWARDAAREYGRFSQWTKHIALWNEINLADEAGGDATDNLLDGDRCAWSKYSYTLFNDWAIKCLTEFRRLCPDAIIHFGAFASGHSEDQDDNGDGTIGIEICADAIKLCDIFDHHDYWYTPEQLFGELSEWYAFRFVKAAELVHRIKPEMPIFISECGWIKNHNQPKAAEHYCYFFQQLAQHSCVLGATSFIWDSGPEHAGMLIWNNEQLVDTLEQLCKATEPEPPPNYDLPDWIVDLRDKATNATGYKIVQPIGIVIHHTANEAPLQNQLAWCLREEDSYHFMVDEDGAIYCLHDPGEVCWHAGDGKNGKWNRGGVAVCFIGLFMEGKMPSDAAFAAYRRLQQWLTAAKNVPSLVIGHKEVPRPTACPGDWYPKYRYRLFNSNNSKLEQLEQRVLLLEDDVTSFRKVLKNWIGE